MAPQESKAESGGPLGKFPCIRDKQNRSDNGIVVHELGAILGYVINNYDISHKMLPEAKTHVCQRSRIQTLIHGAEGAMLLYALAVPYFRWQLPEPYKSSVEGHKAVEETEGKMSVNVQDDLVWLEKELASSTGSFLVSNNVTAADIMMHLSGEFTVERELGIKKAEFFEQVPETCRMANKMVEHVSLQESRRTNWLYGVSPEHIVIGHSVRQTPRECQCWLCRREFAPSHVFKCQAVFPRRQNIHITEKLGLAEMTWSPRKQPWMN